MKADFWTVFKPNKKRVVSQNSRGVPVRSGNHQILAKDQDSFFTTTFFKFSAKCLEVPLRPSPARSEDGDLSMEICLIGMTTTAHAVHVGRTDGTATEISFQQSPKKVLIVCVTDDFLTAITQEPPRQQNGELPNTILKKQSGPPIYLKTRESSVRRQ